MNSITLADFDALVERHSREIFSYLWRLLLDTQDAEDALQDTFLRAFKAFPRLKDHSNLRAWLYKIASNVAYTQLKQRKKIRDHSSDIDLDYFLSESDSPNDYENKDLFKTVIKVINELPSKQCAALILRKYQDISYNEIGEILDCSPESARANVYQSLKKLRKQFGEVEND